METQALNNTTPIDTWRAAKKRADEAGSPRAILGCVGEPLADWLEENVKVENLGIVQRIELGHACQQARQNLVDMVNDHRTQVADEIAGEIQSAIEYCDCDDISGELDLDDSPNDAANKAFAHAAYIIGSNCYHASEIDGDSL
jgi:hypothetical protein